MIKTVGRVALIPVGNYEATKTYLKLDIVSHKGSSYVCLEDNCIGKTPDESPDYWQLIASKGDTGNSIVKVEKTKTEGLVDTYTITYSDETTSTFQITNGQTPVKGTDYYTDTDKKEIVDDVVTAATPNFEQKHTIYRKEVTEEIEAESEMTLDFSYKSENLEVFYCGERLLKDEDYEEVFDEGSETSNKIKILFDIPLSEEFPRYFDFVVKGVIEDA